ncbi:MAG: hypothetical protein AB7P76_00805 [Candidatus Melainabacteria bacterium]
MDVIKAYRTGNCCSGILYGRGRLKPGKTVDDLSYAIVTQPRVLTPDRELRIESDNTGAATVQMFVKTPEGSVRDRVLEEGIFVLLQGPYNEYLSDVTFGEPDIQENE